MLKSAQFRNYIRYRSQILIFDTIFNQNGIKISRPRYFPRNKASTASRSGRAGSINRKKIKNPSIFETCNYLDKSYSLSIIISYHIVFAISYHIVFAYKINIFISGVPTIIVQSMSWMLVLSWSTMFVQTYRVLFQFRQFYICQGLI